MIRFSDAVREYISTSRIKFAVCVTLFASFLVSAVTVVLFTYVIPRDVMTELLIALPITSIVSFPIAWYVAEMHQALQRTNEELELAQQKSLAAEKAKSEFLANMSHEIRTPMNGVLGMAELLSRTTLDHKQQTFADIIVKSGNSLLTIINDILDFSKVDAGQLELDCSPFKLADVVEDVALLVSSKVAEKDLELAVRISPDLPEHFTGDAGRLRQVVANLVGNAVKFTEKGHVYIEVEGEPKNESHWNLRFSIEDTGIGVPEDKLQTIFEKFSQADNSTTRKHEGTGLGLAICSALVELMGGTLRVESIADKGSVFEVNICLPEDASYRQQTKVPVDVSGSRILVVDDNEINRAIILEQLRSWGFDPAAISDGYEAVALVTALSEKECIPGGIVLDYHMPGMNGGEVLREVRKTSGFENVPVIMLTSVDQTEEGERFSRLDVQGCLIKPARTAEFKELLISVLQEANTNDAYLPIEKARAIGNAEGHDSAAGDLLDLAADKIGNSGSLDVLLAEDNEVNCVVFSQILQSAGYSFEIAHNGKDALDDFKRLKPKLVCMDVSMPGMNGFEVTQAIRNMEKGSGTHTPIIGITAHAIDGDRERCLESGMDDYLAKPVSPAMMEDKIRQWLLRNTDCDKQAAKS